MTKNKKVSMDRESDGEDDDEDDDDDDDDEDDDDDDDGLVKKVDKSTEETQLKLFEKKLRERHEKQRKEDQMRKDMLRKAEAEKLKGLAVKRQLKRFDQLLEMRIRMQKTLELMNRLP